MSGVASDLYEFGAYRVDVAQRTFTREGQTISLAPKTFYLLLLLVRSPRRAFSKQELMAALWPDAFVEEANLSFQISVLRKALGEDAGLIETVPKHGYRFAADVRARGAVPEAPATAAGEPGRAVATAAPAATKGWVAAAILGSALLSTLYFVVFVRPTRNPRPLAGVAVPLTSYPGSEAVPSLSPDGSQVAFAWDGPAKTTLTFGSSSWDQASRSD